MQSNIINTDRDWEMIFEVFPQEFNIDCRVTNIKHEVFYMNGLFEMK